MPDKVLLTHNNPAQNEVKKIYLSSMCMKKARYFILIFLLSNDLISSGRNNCNIKVDTAAILNDKNLDGFLLSLKTGHFQTFYDKRYIPSYIKTQLECLMGEGISMGNPNEEYRCCCGSSDTLPYRRLLFFSQSEDIFLITYQTGGIGVSSTIIMLRLKNKKVVDLWTGYGFPEFKSKEEVIRHIQQKRHEKMGIHSNMIDF